MEDRFTELDYETAKTLADEFPGWPQDEYLDIAHWLHTMPMGAVFPALSKGCVANSNMEVS